MNFKYYKSNVLIPLILVLGYIYGIIMKNMEPYLNSFEGVKVVNDYVGVFSIIGLLYFTLFLLDRFLWKTKVFGLLFNIPNLNGRYKGKLISSYGGVEKDCILEITQTASRICVYSYFGDYQTNTISSESSSFTEELIKQPNDLFKLFYSYHNNSDALIELNDHTGTGFLSYFDDNKSLKGEYFNKRLNTGTINVIFLQKKLLKRFR